MVTDPNNLFPFLAAILAEAESGTAGDAIKGVLSFPLSRLLSTGMNGPFEYFGRVRCKPSLVGGLHSARLRVVSRKAVAIGCLAKTREKEQEV